MFSQLSILLSRSWVRLVIIIISCGFFVLSVWSGLSRVSNIHYSGVFQGAIYSKSLGGDTSIEMYFKPQVDELERLSIFPNAAMVEGGFVVPVPFRLYLEEEIVFEGEFIRGTEVAIDRGFHVKSEGISFDRNAVYKLEISMPDVEKGKGYFFVLCRPPDEKDSWIDDIGVVRKGFVLEYMLFGDSLVFPSSQFVLGIFILVCVCLGMKGTQRLIGVLLVGLGLGYLLGVYAWEARVWLYFNEYWPDSYPDMAMRFMDWFSGRISFQEMHEQVLIQRIGQAWFLPLLLAVLSSLGMQMALGYSLISGLSVSLGIIAIVWYLHRNTTGMAALIAALLLPFHVLIIRGMGALQTDGLGFFWSALFIVFFLCFLKAKQNLRFFTWGSLCVVCLFFGPMTRVALLPGLLVPVAVGLWSLVFVKEDNWKRSCLIVLPGLIAALAVFSFWHFTGLLASFFQQWDHSLRAEFTAGNSWQIFVSVMIVGMQGALIAMVPGIRLLMKDIRHVVIVTYFSGLQLFFIVGGIPALNRYWISVGGIGILYAMLVANDLKVRPRVMKTITGLLLAYNLFYLLSYATR